MGYYIDGSGYNLMGHVMMTPENQKLAFEAVHDRLLPESVVRSKARGFSTYGDTKKYHYSWCNMEYLRNDAETFIDILQHLGFHVEKDDEGNIVSMWYNSKSGQENLFLEETAEYWEPGAVIDWTGEDGAHWRSVLPTGEEVEGRVVFDGF